MITHCDSSSVEGVIQWLRKVELAGKLFENGVLGDDVQRARKILVGEQSAYGELRTEINNISQGTANRPRPDPAAVFLADQMWVSIVDKLKPLL